MKKIVLYVCSCVLMSSAWGQVQLDKPWVRATVAGQRATGAFMTIKTVEPVRLIRAQSPVAGVVEIHEMVMEGQIMRMRALPFLEAAKGADLVLQPGGYHIMLMELKKPLNKGDQVPLTLIFENTLTKKVSEIKLEAPVQSLDHTKMNHMGH